MATKAIVIYTSTYGSTEKYAQWTANSLGANIKKINEVSPRELADYDTIVFGAPMQAGKIKGIKLIKQNIDMLGGKMLVVFAVGLAPANETTHKTVWEHNFPGITGDKVKLFSCVVHSTIANSISPIE